MRSDNLMADALASLASVWDESEIRIRPLIMVKSKQPSTVSCVVVDQVNDGKPWFHDI